MGTLNAATLILNGMTLALALGFLLILLWYDSRNRRVQFFAVFLTLITLWNAGSFVLQVLLLVGVDRVLFNLCIALIEFGFSGASVALYVFVTSLAGVHSRNFRLLAFLSLVVVIAYRLLVISTNPVDPPLNPSAGSIYRLDRLPVLFYLLFDVLVLYLVWQYRRKIHSGWMTTGILTFVTGQMIAFFNPEVGIVALSTNISAFGALFISIAMTRLEIIEPMAERNNQISAMHNVSLAITSQLDIDTVLDQIALQAANWLEADAVGIFLRQRDQLDLVNVHNLPEAMRHHKVRMGQGLIGTVARQQKSVFLQNYARDWKGEDDLPFARRTFGSVICVPLIYGREVIGVLIVIASPQGRMFREEDVAMLERLGAQAAVAIAHSRLFREMETARSQLEALLVSTDNPVIALDSDHHIIFANPAARRIEPIETAIQQGDVHKLLLPAGYVAASDVLPDEDETLPHSEASYHYEITLGNRTYLCHLAPLGSTHLQGWVAVMNDITQLKELDRVKSEMIRMASHDLKNPLMGAMLYVDLARERADATQSEMLNVIGKQLDRMQRIIRGVLDLEQVKTAIIDHQECQARRIVEHCIHDMQRMALDQQVSLSAGDIDESLIFIGDVNQFERALTNLIENAIKFTPPGGNVTVSARGEGYQVVFTVEDTGIGIPLEVQPQIFERFYRGRQPGAEHVTGSGLGLSIVKAVVENHNGRIWLESDAGKGARFHIAVPRHRLAIAETERSR